MSNGRNDRDIDELEETVSAQQKQINQLQKTVKKMMPNRRDFLKAGAGAAAGAGLALSASSGSAEGLGDGDTQWGSNSNRDDYVVDHVDANSLDTVDAVINGPLPADPTLVAHLDAVTSDDNRGIRVHTTTTSTASDSEPGRRGGLTTVYPDGMEGWRLTFDAGEDELSLYGNNDAVGSGSSSYATDKLLNVKTAGGAPYPVLWTQIGDHKIEGEAGNTVTQKLIRGGAGDALLKEWRDESGNLLYRTFVDGNDNYKFRDGISGKDVYQYLPAQDRLQIKEPNKLNLQPQTSAPGGTNGDIVYADGTNWDPGSGAGFYGYEEGTWVKL